MPLYVDREHLERAREALRECADSIALFPRMDSVELDLAVLRLGDMIDAALDSTSHATDYMTQPVADYVPTATTITEAAAPAGPTNTAPKEG